MEANQGDLMFLDIQMPELIGKDFTKIMKNQPKVVLTTVYSDYALESCYLNVVDYLLKPIALERFIKCVQKLKSTDIPNINIKETNDLETITLKTDHKL